jgi:hypothetical protein
MSQGIKKPIKKGYVSASTKRKNAPRPAKKSIPKNSNFSKKHQAFEMKQKITKTINSNIEKIMLSRANSSRGTKLRVLSNE